MSGIGEIGFTLHLGERGFGWAAHFEVSTFTVVPPGPVYSLSQPEFVRDEHSDYVLLVRDKELGEVIQLSGDKGEMSRSSCRITLSISSEVFATCTFISMSALGCYGQADGS